MLNELTRPFFGWVSDQIGREQTMFIAFALEAAGIIALYQFGQPVASVMNAAAALMAWFVLRPMRKRHMEKSSLA